MSNDDTSIEWRKKDLLLKNAIWISVIEILIYGTYLICGWHDELNGTDR